MKIMVGYDSSNACREALDLAVVHAKAFTAKVNVVASMTKGGEEEQAQIKQVEQELEEVKVQLENQGVACETHLLIRGLEPGEDLANYAQEQGVDEIVIGIRRRSKVGKLLFGSTAQYVILNAHCPVVTVK